MVDPLAEYRGKRDPARTTEPYPAPGPPAAGPDGGGIFVPLKDRRTDGRVYPGGRYVLDTVKGADLGGDDGCLVVDLNFAYNPSCAYDPAWACPLAPPGNTVDVPVDAGELMPGG